MPAVMLSLLEVPLAGLHCPGCAADIEHALRRIPGVTEVSVLFTAARATVRFDPGRVTEDQIRGALQHAGYLGHAETGAPPVMAPRSGGMGWFAATAGLVLAAALAEQLGVFDRFLAPLPTWLLACTLVMAGWRALVGVARDAARGRVSSHTLLVLGAAASAAIGEWSGAAIILLFIRLAEWLEGLAAQGSRDALRHLLAARPETARVLCSGLEIQKPISAVAVGDVVMVRPGERIPVDGVVVEGNAPVDQSSITGESVPAEKVPGGTVYAATVAQAGFLKIRATQVGEATAFSRIVRLVEEAESRKTPVQRLAGRFAGYYLPVVLLVALATLVITGKPENAVSVLVVACACAIVLATPVVVMASVGYAARQGVLIKGGLALEQLARVDTVMFDKTGTLTRGQARVVAIESLSATPVRDLLQSAAALESRSEHPLGRAVVTEALAQGLELPEPAGFDCYPARGVTGILAGERWAVGSRRLLLELGVELDPIASGRLVEWEARGLTVFFVARSGAVVGLLGLADAIRPEAREAIARLRENGVRRFLMLTGDGEQAAAAVARELGIEYQAGLLPADKVAAVRALQAEGARVLMVGDGINDAPALAQADASIAMGQGGTAVAVEAASAALLRDDLRLIPEAILTGRRAVRTIRQNLGFTVAYNVIGLALAATGLLPPVWAAAAHNLPDLLILANSGRLLQGARGAACRMTFAQGAPHPEAAAGSAPPHGHHCCEHEHEHEHEHAHGHCCAEAH